MPTAFFRTGSPLNNGTTHGIEQSDSGINVDLTAQIHDALAPYAVSGAQHGTSGNNSDRLRKIAQNTKTTKANVATALQMISWGVKVNDFGNAIMDESGSFIKEADRGVTQAAWEKMCAFAAANDWQKGNFKKLNLPFENTLTAQKAPVRERMIKGVEDFVYTLLTDVFNAADTADLVKKQILETQSHTPGFKAEKIEQQNEWNREKIIERASQITADKGPEGNFDD